MSFVAFLSSALIRVFRDKFACLAFLGLFSLHTRLLAEGPTPIVAPSRVTPVDFASEILPILRANCIACHNDQKGEGRLSLERPAAMLKGGEQGPAIVAGKSAESLLLKLAAGDGDPAMPPAKNQVDAKPLNSNQLGLIKLWIDAGATGLASTSREVHWQALPSHYQPTFATAVSPDGRFAIGSRGNRLFVHPLGNAGKPLELIDPSHGVAHRDVIRSLAIDVSGSLLASGAFRELKLWRMPRVVRQSVLQQDVAITAVAAAEGMAATGDERGVVRLWDIASGKILHQISAHQTAVTGLAFSSDKATLYSASLDKSLRAWKASDGTSLGKAAEATAAIQAIAIIHDGKWLISGQADGTIAAWDRSRLSAGEGDASPIKTWKAHDGAVAALAANLASPQEFYSGGEDGFVRRWNAETGMQAAELKMAGPVSAIGVSQDGRRLAAVASGAATLWNTESDKPVSQLQNDPLLAAKVAEIDAQIAFNKSAIALAKADIKSYEGAERRIKTTAESVTKAEEELKKVEKTRDEKKAALEKAKEGDAKKAEAAEKALAEAETAVTVAGTVIERAKVIAERAVKTLAAEEQAVAQREELLKQQEAAKTEATEAAKGPSRFRSLIFSADSQQLIVGSEGGSLHCYDADAGSHCQSLPGDANAVRGLAFGGEARLLAACGASACVYEAPSDWRLVRTIGAPSEADGLADRVLSLDFSPDGRWLLTAGGLPSRTSELKTWNVSDGSLAREFQGAHGDTIFAARFSPKGEHIATAGADRFVKVLDVETGRTIRTFAGHTAHVLGVAWSGDSKLLASCGGDNAVKLWDFETGLPVRTMKGTTYRIGPFKREITSLAFIGDSEQIVACSGDGTVRLLRTSSENDILTFADAKGYPYSVSVTPDGRAIVVGGSDGTLRLWSGQERQLKKSLTPHGE